MLLSEVIMLIVTMFMAIMVIAYRAKFVKLLSQKKSSEVRIGQIAEHFIPFLSQFNHDPKQARFLATPVDYVVFDETGIYFVEVKTGGARLSNNQNKFKQMVLDGKVFWEEIKVTPDGPKVSTWQLDTTTGRFNTTAGPNLSNTPKEVPTIS